MISNSSHTVIEAENGAQGLEMIENFCPDCIILDLLMPEVDGYQVLETLKAKDNRTPVVVCSADIQDTAREKCLALGAAGFLNKPPKQDEIMGLVDKVLGE